MSVGLWVKGDLEANILISTWLKILLWVNLELKLETENCHNEKMGYFWKFKVQWFLTRKESISGIFETKMVTRKVYLRNIHCTWRIIRDYWYGVGLIWEYVRMLWRKSMKKCLWKQVHQKLNSTYRRLVYQNLCWWTILGENISFSKYIL